MAISFLVLALPAAPALLAISLLGAGQAEQPTGHGDAGQQPEHATAWASGGNGASETIEAIKIHPGTSTGTTTRHGAQAARTRHASGPASWCHQSLWRESVPKKADTVSALSAFLADQAPGDMRQPPHQLRALPRQG